MTNRFLISATALALIAGAPAAMAQDNTIRQGGAATQQSPPSGAGGAAAEKNAQPPGGMKSTQSEQKSPGVAKGQRAEDNAPGQKSKSMSSENETKGAAGNMKTDGREDRDNNIKAEGRAGQDKNMKAEGREGHEKNMKAEEREGQEKNMKAEGQGRETNGNMKAEGRSTNPNANVTTGQAGAGAKLSAEQRTKITTVIRNEHVAPTNNIDFSVSVGTRIPRERVSLRPLPSEVVTIYPEWRGYEFFLVRDEIIVVDPRSLEIVAVLPA
jgi:Protein of unknown function (DUF1236)